MGEMCKHVLSAHKEELQLLLFSHPPRQYLAYGKKCVDCGKMNHFKKSAEAGEIQLSIT